MRLLILTIAVAALSGAGFGQSNLNLKVGIVSNVKGNVVCMEIANRRLKAGQAVTVITLHNPQLVRTSTIITKLRKSCLEMDNEGSSSYSLRLRKRLDPFAGIGVVGPKVTAAKGVATADMNGDGKKDYF